MKKKSAFAKSKDVRAAAMIFNELMFNRRINIARTHGKYLHFLLFLLIRCVSGYKKSAACLLMSECFTEE